MNIRIPSRKNSKNIYITVNPGDVLRLHTGERATFIEKKRINFIGEVNGTRYNIRMIDYTGMPTIECKVGFDSKYKVEAIGSSQLIKGDLFKIDGKNQTYMFNYIKGNTVHAINLADGHGWDLGVNNTLVKLDIDKIKKNLK